MVRRSIDYDGERYPMTRGRGQYQIFTITCVVLRVRAGT